MSGTLFTLGGYLGAALVADLFFLKDTSIVLLIPTICAIIFVGGALAARLSGLRPGAPLGWAACVAPGFYIVLIVLLARSSKAGWDRDELIGEVIFTSPISIVVIISSIAGARTRLFERMRRLTQRLQATAGGLLL